MVDIALACVDARIGALLSGANDDERRWTVSANERWRGNYVSKEFFLNLVSHQDHRNVSVLAMVGHAQ